VTASTVLTFLTVLASGQEKTRLGGPYADGETFALEVSVTHKAMEKEAVVYELTSSFAVSCTAKKEKDATRLEAAFSRFSMKGSGGGKKFGVEWDGAKKIEDLDWSGLEAMRDLVKGGYRLTLDAAGNVAGCSSEPAHYLVMTLEPLFSASATWLPGDARAVGEKWEKTVTNDEAEASYTGVIEKREEGRAVVASTVALVDRKNRDAGRGTGKGTTWVDLKTGRPVEAKLSFEMGGSGQTVNFEAVAKRR
jgi:hypothetical protein